MNFKIPSIDDLPITVKEEIEKPEFLRHIKLLIMREYAERAYDLYIDKECALYELNGLKDMTYPMWTRIRAESMKYKREYFEIKKAIIKLESGEA